jgi:hypothetical protein
MVGATVTARGLPGVIDRGSARDVDPDRVHDLLLREPTTHRRQCVCDGALARRVLLVHSRSNTRRTCAPCHSPAPATWECRAGSTRLRWPAGFERRSPVWF